MHEIQQLSPKKSFYSFLEYVSQILLQQEMPDERSEDHHSLNNCITKSLPFLSVQVFKGGFFIYLASGLLHDFFWSDFVVKATLKHHYATTLPQNNSCLTPSCTDNNRKKFQRVIPLQIVVLDPVRDLWDSNWAACLLLPRNSHRLETQAAVLPQTSCTHLCSTPFHVVPGTLKTQPHSPLWWPPKENSNIHLVHVPMVLHDSGKNHCNHCPKIPVDFEFVF